MLELAARFSETLYRGPLAHEKIAGCNMAVCPLHPAPYEEKRLDAPALLEIIQ